MSLRFGRKIIVSAAILSAMICSNSCSSRMRPFNAPSISIDAKCNADPFEATITDDGQVRWKPTGAGAVIFFPKTPFHQNTYTIIGATPTSSGPVNSTAKQCAETHPPKTCKYKYTVSIPSAGCSVDPRVIVSR